MVQVARGEFGQLPTALNIWYIANAPETSGIAGSIDSLGYGINYPLLSVA
ncbi:hypothetical protein ES703_79305 [subsurface metagenome]